ncbi:hypothetical protein QTP86_004817 [Hemibagrus guttatus]|nr:hypothetical protein QTP86_004817 [Hemibagrus guttatus]
MVGGKTRCLADIQLQIGMVGLNMRYGALASEAREYVLKLVKESAVEQAWAREQSNLLSKEGGSQTWTESEKQQLLSNGKMSGYDGYFVLRGKDISTRLMQLSQGRRLAADYAIEFRTLAAQSGWNDVALKAVFQRSLNIELQAELAPLIDSGSALNLIHQDLITTFNIPIQPCNPPLKVNAVNNKPIGDGIIQQTLPMQLQVELFHQETITFYVIDSPRNEIILGCPWLSVHDPVISWHHGEITHWSQFCFSHCLNNTIIKPCLTTSVESPKCKPVTIPSCYHDLQEVFSKTKATQLPPHRPWDCTINLLPNAMPPKSKVYPLSCPETQAMEDYIEEALSSGFIRPSTSPAAAGFFFVEKKDGGLRPCIDYRGLNNVTVKF